LIVYRFPKQQLIFGPLQIEARIDQDPEISSQISLWNQSGSEVIRGNLLVLPVENSLLYVEPLYLQAENGEIPELKRVILASGNRIVMEETLAGALEALFEGEAPLFTAADTPVSSEVSGSDIKVSTTEETPPSTGSVSVDDRISELALTASNHYEAAQAALQEGDWATYGAELDKMKEALDSLLGLTRKE
jgi:hypothetical protein